MADGLDSQYHIVPINPTIIGNQQNGTEIKVKHYSFDPAYLILIKVIFQKLIDKIYEVLRDSNHTYLYIMLNLQMPPHYFIAKNSMNENASNKGVEEAIDRQSQVYQKLILIIIQPGTPLIHANSHIL